MESLEDSCIKNIVKDFDKFIDIFNEGHVLFRRQFEFLQRAYSEKLLISLITSECLQPAHIPFLLNPHLKKLSLINPAFNDADLVISRLKEMGTTVTHFLCCERRWSAEEINKMMGYIPNVEEIDLSDTLCSNDVLKTIQKKCKLVHALDLSKCSDVTNSGIEYLSAIEYPPAKNQNPESILRRLNLQGTNVTDEGIISALYNFPFLKKLNHPNVACVLHTIHKRTKKRIKVLSKQKKDLPMPVFHLKSLKIDISNSNKNSSALEVVVRACIALCPNITKVSVESVSTPKAVEALADFSRLHSVSLSGLSKHKYNLHQFLELKGSSLLRLKLNNMRISLTTVSKCCIKLRKLSISDSVFIDFTDGSKIVSPLPHLKKLELEQLQFDDSADSTTSYCCSVIRSSPNLESLSFLDSYPIAPAIVDCLLQSQCIHNLKELNFSNTDIQPQDVERLVSASSNLAFLDVTDCEFSAEQRESLSVLLKQNNRNIIASLDIECSDRDYSDDNDSDDSFDDYEDYDGDDDFF